MVLMLVEANVEGTIGSADCIRIVPLEILRDAVPEVCALEVWVIAWVEGSTMCVELVAKHKIECIVMDVRLDHDLGRSVRVNWSMPYILEQWQVCPDAVWVCFTGIKILARLFNTGNDR